MSAAKILSEAEWETVFEDSRRPLSMKLNDRSTERVRADRAALLRLATMAAEALEEEARAETHTCPSLSPCPPCTRTEAALRELRAAGITKENV